MFNLSSRSLRFLSLSIEESAKERQKKKICKSIGWQVRCYPTQKYTEKYIEKYTEKYTDFFLIFIS